MHPRKLPPMKFFCEFFLIPKFCFYENFRLKMKNEKSILIQLIDSIMNNDSFILYFSIFFHVHISLIFKHGIQCLYTYMRDQQ